ncbi:hypothetical protein Pfo_001940 [Paulownia fortunei]|nr:hypothetical protein Pfo_001940 [Paulownia fortunei]
MKCPEGWQKINVRFDITKKDNHFPCNVLYYLLQPEIGLYKGLLEMGGQEVEVVGKAGQEAEFGEALLQWRQEGEGGNHSENITGEVLNLMKVSLTTSPQIDNNAEGQMELEQVKRKIRRNYSENPLAWWDKNEIEAVLKIKEQCKYELVRYRPILMNMQDKEDIQTIIKEHLDLKLIQPGFSPYSSPGFLEGLVLSEKKAIIKTNRVEFLGVLIDETRIELQEHIDKKQLQSFLGVVNFAGIFIKDLAKYRKDFSPLLKKDAPFKWEEIHSQRIRELKELSRNLPKLSIPQDEDNLVLYIDANDYRWATVLMRKGEQGEELCRHTGGLFSETQLKWHINEKEFFAVWKAFKKWPLFLLAKRFTLKIDNTNVKAFLNNKIESKIEKARILRWQAECQYYDFDIVVIKSHENCLADFLTRDGGERS